MGFTMARPEVSCHPETLLAGRAHGDLGGALLLRARRRARAGRGSARRATRGRTATRSCGRSSTRSAAGSAAPTACSSTRTTTSTARARRARASASTARTRSLITRRHGSWVVLGTLVTDRRGRAVAPARRSAAARARLCIDACPTGALDEPGTLDATRCLSYWTQAPDADPGGRTARELGALVYGCDICQDVCPWNRGVEKRRAGDAARRGAEPNVSLVEWLARTATSCVERYDRLYVPRNEPRWLRRNALVARGQRRRRRRASRRSRAYADGRRRRCCASTRTGRSPGSTSGAANEPDPDPRASSGVGARPARGRAGLVDRDELPAGLPGGGLDRCSRAGGRRAR